MWDAYAAAHPQALRTSDTFSVDRFGDSLELANELLEVVINGPKRATATLAAEFRAAGEPLPEIGSHWVACDGNGTPRAILRTIELRVATFPEVDERFAWDEGEDDRSLESWRVEHRRYFERTCAARGESFSEQDEIILERFAVVWPPEVADRRHHAQ
nr:ASCH domain-containing protein [Microbacterium humi]